MKRINYLLLTSVMMVSSCLQDRITGLQQDSAIEFRVVMDRQAKATGYTPANLTRFNVTAWNREVDRTVGAPYIDQEEFTRMDDGTYKSADNHFWPSGTLDFYAYAPVVAPGNGLTRISELEYTVCPLADTDDQIDFLFAKNSGNKAANALSGVTLNFRHVMSQIRVVVKNTDPGLRFVVTGWKIAKVDGLATFSFDNSLDTNGGNTNTVSRDLWTGNDGSDATYVKQSESRTVTDNNSTWGELSGSAILIPQITDMATAYSGNTLNGSYIAVELQVFNTSDGEELISRQWCCWPVRYDWAPGYRYNYTIDLAECGYKETGSGELDPVLDLVEVKFVDVTVDNWQPDGGADIDLPLNDNNN